MNKTIFASVLSVALISQGFLAMPAAAQTSSSYMYLPPQPTSYCPQLSYNLYRGLSDYYTVGQVSQLQQFLASQGYYQPVTGYFGSLTGANVAQFQRQHSIYPVTGGVGPLTRAAIWRLCGGTNPNPGSTTFYLNQPFNLSVNQTAQQYNGQLDVTLNTITLSPYTMSMYPGYTPATSATFTLGQRCQAGTQCFYYPTQQFTLTPGQSTTWQGYTVTLTNLNTSYATFTVTSGSTVGNLSITSPTAGQVYARGSIMPITWSYPVTPGSNAAVVLDLYTAVGSKVGTIAISSNLIGSSNWTVPVPNTVCTMQYPNGLCGQSLQGQYYIKATVVTGSGFDSNATTLSTAQSGVFTIQ